MQHGLAGHLANDRFGEVLNLVAQEVLRGGLTLKRSAGRHTRQTSTAGGTKTPACMMESAEREWASDREVGAAQVCMRRSCVSASLPCKSLLTAIMRTRWTFW